MSGPWGELRVLVVDDNPHMRRIVAAIVQGLGVRELRQAADGAAGLEMLRASPADVALVDYAMEPVNGLEFTRALRTGSDSPAPQLPVIMISAHAGRRRVEAARDAGVNEFVSKPLTAQALLDRLDAVLLRPRPFVRGRTYTGPDRRRRADPDYAGPLRRRTDGREDRTYELDG